MSRKKQDPQQWMPPMAKVDEACTITEIWSRYHKDIAKLRGFRDPEGTISSYTATLKIISAALNDKPAALMDIFDCLDAVMSVLYRTTGIHAGEPYSLHSLQTRMTILSDIFQYLESKAICMDPFWMSPSSLSDHFFDWGYSGENGIDNLKLEISRVCAKQVKVRSLSPAQEYQLVQDAKANFNGPESDLDGRWFGLLLYLYLGTRPSEGRGLHYHDCHTFSDDPTRHYIDISHSSNKDGEVLDHVKSRNGIRRLPVHIELEKLMEQWVAIVHRMTGKTDLSDLPMICCGTDFEHPCSATDLTIFVKQALQKVVPAQDLRAITLAVYAEEYQNPASKCTNAELSSDCFSAGCHLV